MVSTYIQKEKKIHGKNGPNSPDFKEKINPNYQIFIYKSQ
jgi:hypothetical protein